MIWLIIAIVAAAGIVFAIANDLEAIVILSIIAVIASLICFFAIPIKGYMKVESIHWQWTVDVYTYSAVNKSGKTSKKGTKRIASAAAENEIPENAYDIRIEIFSEYSSDTDTTNYYAEYYYTVDEWVKTSEVSSFGSDKNPYEPERPYNTEAPDVLGNNKCGYDHTERYTVTGVVDGKKYTYDISKSDWESFYVNAEFEYSKFRFGKELFNVDLAM